MTAMKKKSAPPAATDKGAAGAALQSSVSQSRQVDYTTPLSKIKAPICGLTSVLGFFLMLGSAGGVETGALPEIKGYIWCFVGLGMFWLGAKAGGAL